MSSGVAQRAPVSASSLDLLINAYYEYLLGAGCASGASAGLAAREDVFERVESVGYRIGRRYAERLARDRERLSDALDVMKFICREFWTDVFRKVRSGGTRTCINLPQLGAASHLSARPHAAALLPVPRSLRSPWTSCRRTTRAPSFCRT